MSSGVWRSGSGSKIDYAAVWANPEYKWYCECETPAFDGVECTRCYRRPPEEWVKTHWQPNTGRAQLRPMSWFQRRYPRV